MEWKSSSFSGWETLLKANCRALLYTSRVKIAGMFQEPILLEEKNASCILKFILPMCDEKH